MIHQNPDSSVTEGLKVEPAGTFVGHTIGIVITSAAGIGATVAAAVAKGPTQAICQADGGDIRYRLDGTNPTAAVGVLIKNGATLAFNMSDAAAAIFIQATASTAVLNVTYTM